MMDLLPSINGGIARFLISQPFDFVRVKMQTGNPHDTLWKNIKQTFNKYGIYGFYRGGMPFFWGNMGATMVQWNVFFTMTNNNQIEPLLAGMTAGGAGSLFTCPMERLRILKINDLVDKKSLLVKNFWKGWKITCTRDAIGYGAFFYSYDYFKKLFPQQKIHEKIITNAISGVCLWTTIFPLDTIKTKIQASENYTLMNAIKDIYIKNGLKGFFCGFSTCLLRAVPVNVAMIGALDVSKKIIHNN